MSHSKDKMAVDGEDPSDTSSIASASPPPTKDVSDCPKDTTATAAAAGDPSEGITSTPSSVTANVDSFYSVAEDLSLSGSSTPSTRNLLYDGPAATPVMEQYLHTEQDLFVQQNRIVGQYMLNMHMDSGDATSGDSSGSDDPGHLASSAAVPTEGAEESSVTEMTKDTQLKNLSETLRRKVEMISDPKGQIRVEPGFSENINFLPDLYFLLKHFGVEDVADSLPVNITCIHGK